MLVASARSTKVSGDFSPLRSVSQAQLAAIPVVALLIFCTQSFAK